MTAEEQVPQDDHRCAGVARVLAWYWWKDQPKWQDGREVRGQESHEWQTVEILLEVEGEDGLHAYLEC